MGGHDGQGGLYPTAHLGRTFSLDRKCTFLGFSPDPNPQRPGSVESQTGTRNSWTAQAKLSFPPSPPTSPGLSKIDIHPFLKLSRSGCGEMRKWASQAPQKATWAGEQRALCPSCPSLSDEVLGNRL